MKQLWLVGVLLVALLGACNSNEGNSKASDSNQDLISTELIKNPNTRDNTGEQSSAMPAMNFVRDTYDFGEIIQGEKVQYNFRFTNTGKSDLVISSASASCGCTVPSYPKEPIAPGEEGVISVTYDSNGRNGTFRKDVRILANTIPNKNTLWISGSIIIPEQ